MHEEDPWAVRKEIARRLSESYPTWNVWITLRTWWATRKTPLPDGSLKRGLYMTLVADTPGRAAETDRRADRASTAEGSGPVQTVTPTAARRLGVSEQTLAAWARDGELTEIRIPQGSVVYPVVEIAALATLLRQCALCVRERQQE